MSKLCVFDWLTLQVSQLLLLSGASPNTHTDVFSGAPMLCVSARQGHRDMVSRLLEFGANVNSSAEDGVNALCYSAQQGHVDIIGQLVSKHAKVSE